MFPQIRKFAAGLGACGAFFATAPAHAREVLLIDAPRAVVVDDPFAPAAAESDLGREPRGRFGRAAARPSATAAAKRRRRSLGQRAVLRALAKARRERRISRAAYRSHRRIYALARSRHRRLGGTRRYELGSVIGTLEAIARARGLTASRMPALFLILRRNAEFWPSSPFPADRGLVQFRGSQLMFEYYAGEGLQLQPLVNFKKAIAMQGTCVRGDGPCPKRALRRLLSEMVATSASRGGFRAWEYYFEFGGGRPPWMSGMAQVQGIQAFARVSELLGEPGLRRYAVQGLPAFETPPPVGVATRGPLGGTHYLQYSFAPRLFIINAFLQAVVGLYDYAKITGDARALRLYRAAEPEARRELPRNDTGDWSTYSFRGAESTREYHELLREVVKSLCGLLHRDIYCDTARRFADYTTEPAELELLGPSSATKGTGTRMRFSLSKLSAVQITITRDGKMALNRTATFRRGTGSFAFKPGATGIYEVRLTAKELRTGRGLRTRTSGDFESVPAG
ncbi:MAG: D-glucuronyl C5-epimerase family protein [Actinomycetota bacterium]